MIVALIILSIIVVSMTIIYLMIEKMLGAELWSVLLCLSILITVASRVIKSSKWSIKGFYVSASMIILSSISSIGLYMEYTSYGLTGALIFISTIIFFPLYMIFLPHLLLRRYITKRFAGQSFPKRLSLKNSIYYIYTRIYVYLPRGILHIFYATISSITLLYSLDTISSRTLPIIHEELQRIKFTISVLPILSIIIILMILSDTIHAYVRGSIGENVGVLDSLINNIKNQLKSFRDEINKNEKSISITPDSITMAIYRLDEFINRFELGDLEKSYVELTSALEAICLWRFWSQAEVSFNDGKSFSHSEIRGAIVHGFPKEKSVRIDERLNYFRTDPLTPIIDLLKRLKDHVDNDNLIKEIIRCSQRRSRHSEEV